MTRKIYDNDAKCFVKDFAAAQRSRYIAMCPRCGRPAMEHGYNSKTMGSLSRQARVYVCSDCADVEDVQFYNRLKMLPLRKWALFDK